MGNCGDKENKTHPILFQTLLLYNNYRLNSCNMQIAPHTQSLNSKDNNSTEMISVVERGQLAYVHPTVLHSD